MYHPVPFHLYAFVFSAPIVYFTELFHVYPVLVGTLLHFTSVNAVPDTVCLTPVVLVSIISVYKIFEIVGLLELIFTVRFNAPALDNIFTSNVLYTF